MNALAALLARDTCQQLMTAYCTHLDDRDEEAFISLFTDDVVFGVAGRLTKGKQPIRESLRARPASLLSWHLMLNHRIELQGEDKAEGSAIGLVVRGNRDRDAWPMPIRGVELLMSYCMAFRRENDCWLIVRCETARRLDVDAPPATEVQGQI